MNTSLGWLSKETLLAPSGRSATSTVATERGTRGDTLLTVGHHVMSGLRLDPPSLSRDWSFEKEQLRTQDNKPRRDAGLPGSWSGAPSLFPGRLLSSLNARGRRTQRGAAGTFCTAEGHWPPPPSLPSSPSRDAQATKRAVLVLVLTPIPCDLIGFVSSSAKLVFPGFRFFNLSGQSLESERPRLTPNSSFPTAVLPSKLAAGLHWSLGATGPPAGSQHSSGS